MVLAMGVMVRRRASIAELSDMAPIWEGWVAPVCAAARASLLAVMVSRSFPRHGRREMGR